MLKFGKVIKQAREAIGLSQKDLASRVQKSDDTPISPQFLNDIENGRRLPSDDVLESFAVELKIDTDYLYYLADRLPLRCRNVLTESKLKSWMKAFDRETKKQHKEENNDFTNENLH